MSEIKISVQDISPVQKKIQVIVPPAIVDETYRRVADRIRQRVRIKGFRPGKAPAQVIERMYGGQIVSEAAAEVINRTYHDAIQQHGMKPVDDLRVEQMDTFARGSEFKYEATVEVLGPVELKQYKGLVASKPLIQVADADVERVLKQLREERAELREVAEPRPIARGDYPQVELETTLEGRPLSRLSSKSVTIAVGEAWVFPEVDEALTGMLVGESKDIDISVQPDSPHKDLIGKTVHVKLKVLALKEKVLPVLDDEFAKDVGDPSLAELRHKIREGLETRLRQEAEAALRESVIDALLAANPVEVSPALVARQTDEFVHRALRDFERRGHAPDENLHARLFSQLRPAAERRIKTELLLAAVAEIERIAVDKSALESYFEREAQRSGTSVDAVRSALAGRLEDVIDRLRLDKALDLIVSEAKVSEVEAPKA